VFIRVFVSASLGYPTSATSYGWEIQKSITIPRYESQTTKSPELVFSALLGDDSARDVHFERVLALNAIWGAVCMRLQYIL
jgi:hypothetical protein